MLLLTILQGRHVGLPENYYITECWRGAEQPLDTKALILDVWNEWGTAQSEVNLKL